MRTLDGRTASEPFISHYQQGLYLDSSLDSSSEPPPHAQKKKHSDEAEEILPHNAGEKNEIDIFSSKML